MMGVLRTEVNKNVATKLRMVKLTTSAMCLKKKK